MAEKKFKLEIVTPERLILSKEIVSVVVPGAEGSIGILAGHSPLMSEIIAGEVWMRDADGHVDVLAISGGFMEVRRNSVRILADTAEMPADIDIARAEAAKRRAEERLRLASTDVDMARAEAALKRAIARLRVAQGG